MYKEFYQQSIWQDGLRLLEKIYEMIKNFPLEEKYNLSSQLRRSVYSVIANFAEIIEDFSIKIRLEYCILPVAKLKKPEVTY